MPITPPENSVGGQIWAWTKIDCGPSIGLVRRPLFNDKYLTSGSSYSVQPFDWRLLVNLSVAATFEILLPDVSVWMKQPYGLFPIQVKDVGQTAGTQPITVTPFGTQRIDGLDPATTPVQLNVNGASLTVEPRSDLSGWNLLP